MIILIVYYLKNSIVSYINLSIKVYKSFHKKIVKYMTRGKDNPLPYSSFFGDVKNKIQYTLIVFFSLITELKR